MKPTIRYAKLFLLLLLPLLGLTGCGMVDSMAGYSEAKDLQRSGVAAQAKILSVDETGMSINDDPVIRINVEVQPADGAPPFPATIKRLLVSRLEIPQYQPGIVIAVRYDPKDTSRVSIDLGPPAAAKTGNPFADNFVAQPAAAELVAPPPAPALYRGTADVRADVRALNQNGYAELGEASFGGGTADVQQALDQGVRIHAAMVVVYGQLSAPQGGATPAPLPFQADADSAAAPARQAAGTGGAAATIGALPPPPPDQHAATYWGKVQQPILGVDMRPLTDEEKDRLMRSDGVYILLVMNHTPASGRLLPGDVITAIDGKKILDFRALTPFLRSIAGRNVRIDLLRYGAPTSVDIQLNPLPPG